MSTEGQPGEAVSQTRVQRVLEAVTRAALAQPYEFGDWLDQWEALPFKDRQAAISTVRRLLQLQDDINSVFGSDYRADERDRQLKAIGRAGKSLASGGGAEVANAIADAVERSLSQQRAVNDALRALQMLFAGIIVQGGMLAIIFGGLLRTGFPEQLLGMKTLTLMAVGISGIVGSLARAVNEARTEQETSTSLFALG